MRYNKFAALISAASMAVMSAMPVMQANAEAPDLSFIAEPVFEYFNKADVNGAIGIKLPDTVSAHVEISFDSPEGLDFPYYVTDIKDGQGMLFLVEGYSNTEDDYRNYHLSIEMTGGLYGAKVRFSRDFTVPDGNDEPDSFYAVGYRFELDDELSSETVELTGTETSTIDYNEQKITGEINSYNLNINGYLMGDVSGDGVVDGTDATLVLREFGNVLAGEASSFDARQLAAGDIDSNGAIDGSDATLILKYFGLVSAYQDPVWEDIIPKA